MSGIQKAIELAGGQTQLAQKLGVTQQLISVWAIKGRPPPQRVPQIVAALEGQITKHELRPDLWEPAE